MDYTERTIGAILALRLLSLLAVLEPVHPHELLRLMEDNLEVHDSIAGAKISMKSINP
jgi:hypothetical protein